jgi:hypothetical protein
MGLVLKKAPCANCAHCIRSVRSFNSKPQSQPCWSFLVSTLKTAAAAGYFPSQRPSLRPTASKSAAGCSPSVLSNWPDSVRKRFN